jgi:hypothetical protein
MEDSVKHTDTQLRLLAAASQRDDRALERPSNLTGGAAGKVVAKLLTEGLVEEIQSRGSLPVWRRDDEGARCLRITKKGLHAIRVEAEVVAGAADEPAKKPPAPSVKRRKSTDVPPSRRNREADKPPGDELPKGDDRHRRHGLQPGTILVREWDGKSQRVTVLDQGFAWNGATYRSLTEIAFAMTGTRWSGPRFFGLRREKRA